ncbi:MAG TPA: YihY/virulence factor BrkB family protein [Candidatus Limnocylindrales bacterium]|nr:YihY/virulence factor BrkB family protein [Candidatus Limnocylindrales bacterium]
MRAPEANDEGALLRWRRRFEGAQARLLAHPRMAVLVAANRRFEAAGGGLLAAGLAFRLLFAVLPGLMLAAGLAGWLVEDPVVRGELVAAVLRAVPPLAEAVGETLRGIVEYRGTVSVIGLLGLAWGASALYDALDEAIGRLIPGTRRRNMIERRLLGLAIVLALLGAAVSALVVGTLGVLTEGFGGDGAGAAGLGSLLGLAVTGALTCAAVLAVYRYVPTTRPSLRASLVPAIVAGLGIALLTAVYATLAPRLIGALSAFGAFAALFGAIIWLGYVCQLLLIGAAWVGLRRDEELG